MFKKKLMEEMSWSEFKAAVLHQDTALVPFGSVEEEGPHLPLAVDSIVAMDVARRVAEQTDGTMVTPLLHVTYSDWHRGFDGTLSLSMPTLFKVTEEYCLSLCEQGFRRIFFVNAHVGNEPPIWITANELTAGGRARVGAISLWPLAAEIAQGRPEFRESKFMHAGELMTSAVMAIRPDLVDMSKAVPERLKPMTDGYETLVGSKSRFKGKSISFYHLTHELTASGVMGDPTAATAEKGEFLLGAMAAYIGEAVTEFRRIPLPAA